MNAQLRSAQDASHHPGGRQVLTFRLGEEFFGIDIMRVQEIRSWSVPTHLPKAPAHMLGVLELRGTAVPIIDLRVRLDMERAEFTAVTAVIVVSLETPRGASAVGIVVDSVADVMDIDERALMGVPSVGGYPRSAYVDCLAAVDERMFILLDLETLLGDAALCHPGYAPS